MYFFCIFFVIWIFCVPCMMPTARLQNFREILSYAIWSCLVRGLWWELLRNYDFFKKSKLQKKYKKNTQKLHFCCFQNYPQITQKLHWHFCSFQNYKKNSQKIQKKYNLHRFAVQMVLKMYFLTIFFVILKTAKMSM